MNIRRIIEKRVRERLAGVDVERDTHVAVAANVGEDGAVTAVSSTQDDGRSDNDTDAA